MEMPELVGMVQHQEKHHLVPSAWSPMPINPTGTAWVPPYSRGSSASRTKRGMHVALPWSVNSGVLLAAAQSSPSAPTASCFSKEALGPFEGYTLSIFTPHSWDSLGLY